MSFIPKVLIIAGSDSGGGAGIQADIKAITYFKGYAMTAVTAITAQNTMGVQSIFPLPKEIVIEQINSVTNDLAPDIVKIGMLADEEIIDYGPETADRVAEILKSAKTIIWNGPCGVFEFDAFAKGTEVVARAIAESDAFSIAGGGDTLAAIDKFGLADKISYISTGGGAFLEYVEGKELPAVAILEARAAE